MKVEQKIQQIIDGIRQTEEQNPPRNEAMGAWFFGPRGESQELLGRLIALVLENAAVARKISYPDDPWWADAKSRGYQRETERIETYMRLLMKRLADYSIPWYSYRYQGHMNWDISIPAAAAYFGAMLYNQNNVAAEGGPVTTALEIYVAEQLCKMVDYGSTPGDPRPWGHITCDGSVANIEALWAARNLKLYPFAVWRGLNTELRKYNDFKVNVTGGERRPLAKLGWWELLNLSSDVILGIPERLRTEKGIGERDLSVIQQWTAHHLGLSSFATLYDDWSKARGELRNAVERLCVLAPASAHYSLSKGATLLGLGTQNFVPVPIGKDARVDVNALERAISDKIEKKLPILSVVAVIGTTQEGAADDLSAILKVREASRKNGNDFLIHADAAWGGYFASLLRRPKDGSPSQQLFDKIRLPSDDPAFVPKVALDQFKHPIQDQLPAHEQMILTAQMTLNGHCEKQLEMLREADTVTIDPHKSGFVPYPAGALLYRNVHMPQMVRITAPVVYHEGKAPTVGVFGIEGSKPGASAAAVWLSHQIIHPDLGGYGRVLGRCVFNAKRLYAELATMNSDDFVIATLQQLTPGEKNIVKQWLGLNNERLWQELADNPGYFVLFREMGPDLNINTFALNPMLEDAAGKKRLNTDPEIANAFNDRVFRALSLEYEGDSWPPVVITGSQYESAVAGEPIKKLRNALKLKSNSPLPMKYLLSTTMNPWMSDAEGGSRNMVREVAEHLKRAIEREVIKFNKSLGRGK